MTDYGLLGEYLAAKYPFAAFFDGKQIDYDTFSIKSGVNIGAFFVGFDEECAKVFSAAVANNQFIKIVDGGVAEIKKVKYFLFGKDEKVFEGLGKGVLRYKKSNLEGTGEYAFLPDEPCDASYFQVEEFDGKFFESLSEKFYGGKNDLNFIFAKGKDEEESRALTEKLLEEKKRKKLENVIIFALCENFCEDKICGKDVCKSDFCGDKSLIFAGSVPDGFEETTERFAVLRNAYYDLQYDVSHGKKVEDGGQKAIEEAREKFSKKVGIDRKSSVYGCLSLRSKLAFLGLDFAKGEKGISEEDFFEIYAGDDLPDFEKFGAEVCGKKIIDYDGGLKENTKRFYAAVQEHARWNAFYLAEGYLPAKTKDVFEETAEKNGKKVFTNGKNADEKRHGNLTTFAGLKEFAKGVAARDGVSADERDVIRYDYQILDDAYFMLLSLGYGIVRKGGRK